MDPIEGLFRDPRWRSFRQALTERHEQLLRGLENWQPVPGVDAGTNLAEIACRLREMATLRWVRDDVPTLLTEAERMSQEEEARELAGGGHGSEFGAEEEVIGEDRYGQEEDD